jgi:hypothetical protein
MRLDLERGHKILCSHIRHCNKTNLVSSPGTGVGFVQLAAKANAFEICSMEEGGTLVML